VVSIGTSKHFSLSNTSGLRDEEGLAVLKTRVGRLASARSALIADMFYASWLPNPGEPHHIEVGSLLSSKWLNQQAISGSRKDGRRLVTGSECRKTF
jgi:hypothetical protein